MSEEPGTTPTYDPTDGYLESMAEKFTKIGFNEMPYISGPRYINLGFNKTGTTTIGKCFEILKLGPVADDNNTYEYLFPIFANNNYGPALHLASKFRSFEDRPWNIEKMWKMLDILFDETYYFLTIRDPEIWYTSVFNWLTVTNKGSRVKELSYLHHLNITSFEKHEMINAYNNHNNTVIEYFKNKTNLLVINFEEGDGWKEICDYLNIPEPNEPFPHANSQHYSE